ncbi:hypothetical protein SAMN05421837_12320 [Amycolatopsis pretoriensis]|uniref:PE family protein n=1 Tax=Amycolatopsis pretoriensis TaxID=218821 RepID=A0A1H5RJS6_9PSEU|nr:hypothetical protein [Amycolatopsis pretoriensis]SEF38500.1 hypothetical protein SAMN05421837_12320 [Amycolatopsis pretoriensis]
MADSTVFTSVSGLAGAQMMELAESRRFTVDEATGTKMIEALEGTLRTLEKHWDALQRLREVPAMGATATARWASAQMESTAGREQDLLSQLEAARQHLPRYIEAIRLAIRNHANTPSPRD